MIRVCFNLQFLSVEYSGYVSTQTWPAESLKCLPQLNTAHKITGGVTAFPGFRATTDWVDEVTQTPGHPCKQSFLTVAEMRQTNYLVNLNYRSFQGLM